MIELAPSIVHARQSKLLSTVSDDDSRQWHMGFRIPYPAHKGMDTLVLAVNYQIRKHCGVCRNLS